MADLVFLHFYFSCKTYQELAQASITEVVGSFKTNPTKLCLHFSKFSTIFYAIYKILQNSNTI
jgi:membrane protein insertase Oxa1/YidC/SpoIIIJ